MSSFRYPLLWNCLLTHVERQGLDPYEGVLHAGSARQAALVSDLIEPLPTLLVDPLKVWLIRTGQLRVDEACEQGEKGVILPEVGRRVWLRAWSTPMAEKDRWRRFPHLAIMNLRASGKYFNIHE